MRTQDEGADIDSFIMSCRAMGRGIESAIMNHLKQRCFETLNIEAINAQYAPTKKNKPVEIFFEEQGFEIARTDEAGPKHYRLLSEKNRPQDCSWIQVNTEDE